MAEQHDYKALDWVRDEIEATLNQALQSLEAYLDDNDDTTRMRFCVTHLHQVAGTLQMVEFYGAALLAEEMENLAVALMNQRVKRVDDAQQVLMQAILQLPAYLDGIKDGRRDVGVVVLPLLNDLRAARDEPLLSETALFKPDFTANDLIPVPISAEQLETSAELPEQLAKMRQLYQFALVSVIRDEDVDTNLEYMTKTLAKLESLFSGRPLAQLWWVAAGVTEALGKSFIPVSTSVKMLLGQLDQELKLCVDEASSIDREAPRELLKNLLYYVTRSEGVTARIEAIQSAFKLDNALLSEELLENERQLVMGPDHGAIVSVVKALLEELGQIKAAVNAYNSDGQREALQAIGPELKQVADTLAVLGVGSARRVVLEQHKLVQQILANEVDNEESVLMDVAGGLLYVEATLAGMIDDPGIVAGQASLPAESEAETDDDNSIPSGQLNSARMAAVDECRIHLADAKEAIAEYSAQQFNVALLAQVPSLLNTVRGSLMMIPLTQPAVLLQGCLNYIQDKMTHDGAQPEWGELEKLADAISSIDYYLECLDARLPDKDDVLIIAHEALEALGYPPDQINLETMDVPVLTSQASLRAPASDANAAPQSYPVISQAPIEPPPIAEPESNPDPQPTPEPESMAEPEPAPPTIPMSESESAPVPSAPVVEDNIEDMDEELLEIFVEEAGEVLEAINEQLPLWQQNMDNEEALKEVRRAYHTLKGSGRMVGANVIGELAWSVENLLNRVLDGGVTPSAEIGDLVAEVTAVVPSLITAIEQKQPSGINTTEYSSAADRLAKGETGVDFPGSRGDAATATQSPAETAPEEPAADIPVLETVAEIESLAIESPEVGFSEAEAVANESSELESAELEIDPVLIDIFSQEAASHLETIRQYLQQDQSENFTENMLRALHTLKGSAHMAGIAPIAGLATPVERFFKECHLQGVKATPDLRLMLDDFVNLLETGLLDLKSHPNAEIVGVNEFLQRLGEAREDKLMHLDEEINETVEAGAVDVFLADGMQLVADSGDDLRQWEQNPTAGAQLDKLTQDLRVLARGASAVDLPDIVSLALTLEELYNGVGQNLISTSPQFFHQAHEAHEALVNMMDSVASHQEMPSVDMLIGNLQALIDDAPEISAQIEQAEQNQLANVESADFDAENEQELEFIIESDEEDVDQGVAEVIAFELEPELDQLTEQDEAPVPTNVTPLMPEMDEAEQELVEIFLEEAGEILDQTDTELEAWIQQPDDLEVVGSLQRNLHTLKGGARMSEIKSMGDLAHHLENLYEGLYQKHFQPSEDLFELLRTCHDRLAGMYQAIASQANPEEATDLIDAITHYVQTGLVAVDDSAADEALATDEAVLKPDAETEEDKPEVAEKTVPKVPVEPVADSVSEEPVSEPAFEKAPSEDSEALAALGGQGEEVDTELLEIFLAEAEELTAGLDHSINAWLGERENSAHPDEIKRLLHTLKGGARLAGLSHIGDLSHDFETFLIDAETQQQVMDDEFFAQVQQSHDSLLDLMEQLRTEGAAYISSASELQAQQDKAPKAPVEEIPLAPVISLPTSIQAMPVPMEAVELPASGMRADEGKRASNESVKVAAELMEGLVNLAGETSIFRGRIEQEITDFNFVIEEIGMTIERARELLRRMDIETEAQILHRHQQAQSEGIEYEDFDPLEMDRYSTLNQISRSLGETVSDLHDLKDSLMDRARDAETLLIQQGRINTELQESLMRTRMVPFSGMVPRLRRIVRQIAGELGKKAELEIFGADGEMDRTVLERMVAPLEHMLRNAVDHGLETPEEREQVGKPATGRITIHLSREGGEVVLRLADDGKGVNLEGVKRRAIERGLMTADSSLPDKEIMQFIFKQGFSTAEKVTQISGRGVGMDVVHSEIKQLGGAVRLHSAPGSGSQFTIRLPFTVSVNRALMVRVGEDLYAVPLNNIEGIVRVSPYELEAYYDVDAPPFEYAGQQYDVRYLGRYVHNTQIPNLRGQSKPLPVLLVRSAERAVALQVDSLLGSKEIVVKSVGPQLAAVSGISGATILGDGSVVIIVDVNAVIRAEQAMIGTEAPESPSEEIPEQQREMPLVMVVDDSVTVRKVTGRLLERNGFEVATAKDGVDAITKLQEIKPEIILLDIEMPRMDGFEVAKLVRHDERLKHTPIIMITSRTGEKHRDRAASIGVNEYMGKPYQETELLETIGALIGERK